MYKRLSFFLFYTIFWLTYFYVAKLIFLFYEYSLSFQMPLSDWVRVFFYGSRIDISTVGYLLGIPALTLSFTAFIDSRHTARILNVYTIIILVITSVLIVADMELYRHWGFRMDSTPLLFISNPKEIIGSLDWYIIVLQLFIWLIYFSAFLFLYYRFLSKYTTSFPRRTWKTSFLFLFITATLILPIRGSLGVAPMNVGFVYFHETNVFANHSAVNVVWNVGHSFTEIDRAKESTFFEQKQAKLLVDELYQDEETSTKVLRTDRPNIVIIILESFSSKIIKPLGGLPDITPQLNRLIHEGILFDEIYASGDRTDRGVPAILNGMPAHPTTSIMRYPNKTQKLPFINKDLQKIGYSSLFMYGGDINFANFNSYIANGQFQELITKADFPSSQYYSKWGVSDEYVFDKLLEKNNEASSPFIHVMLTLSSHEPFKVPMPTVIEGDDKDFRFLNSAYYTDQCIGDFIEKAKKQAWWDNTLIIFVADHATHRPGATRNYAMQKFQIPLLWLGGALSKTDTIIHQKGNQTDISKSLLWQMNLPTEAYQFSQNLLSNKAHSFATYHFNNGFGFTRDSLSVIFDNVNKKYILQEGVHSPKDLEYGKAYMQIVTNYFNKL